MLKCTIDVSKPNGPVTIILCESLIIISLSERHHFYPLLLKYLRMLGSYIRIASRNLRKNRIYSFINIIGLSMGMAVTLLIGLWVWDELSFNKYHSNYEHIAT